MTTVPRHRPPFGVAVLLKHAAFGAKITFADVEQQYANELEVDHAVWIPSARFGIAHAIMVATGENESVQCMAFNCGAVLHAVDVAGRDVEFVDCETDHSIPKMRSANACVVSEVFGWRSPTVSSRFVIYDMAMCLPTVSDMQRLGKNHAAVLSFGLGKPMAAGGGGMLLTNNATLCEAVRQQRDAAVCVRRANWKSDAKFIARTVAHDRRLYGFARSRSSNQANGFSEQSPEWNRRPSQMMLRLCLRNLRTLPAQRSFRQNLAADYDRRLAGYSWLIPPPEKQSHSHYSIRVPRGHRDELRRELHRLGVDSGTLFPLDARFRTTDFPNASRLQSEMINLPLHHGVTQQDLRQVSALFAAWDMKMTVNRKAA